MLTINRDRTEDKRSRAYSSKVRDRYDYDSYRTLEEDYQSTVRENEDRRKSDLWDRLNAPSQNRERQDFSHSSAYNREQETYRLPYYDTEAPVSSMAMKKYPVHTAKKKTNITGKIILAVYVAVIALVASLVIVDSTMKTTAASSGSAPKESEYSYIAVENTEASTNWFDQFCDSISKAMGD